MSQPDELYLTLDKPRIAFYDLETTGLNYYHDLMIEAAAEVDGKKFSKVCNIGDKRLPEIITKLTGITEEILKDAISENQLIRKFCHFVGRTRSPVYLIAHNNDGFDKWFLKIRANKNKIRLPQSWRFLDSLQLAKLIYPNRDSYSLHNLCKDLGVKQIQAHRAGDDVRCLREIYIIMANRYNKLNNLQGEWDEHVEAIWKDTQCL